MTMYLSEPKVKSLLYIILRDYLPAGVVNKIFRDHVLLTNQDTTYSDKFIEAQAQHLIDEHLKGE